MLGNKYGKPLPLPTDDLVRCWRSKVKVTPWFKYVVAMAFTSTLGHQSTSSGGALAVATRWSLLTRLTYAEPG